MSEFRTSGIVVIRLTRRDEIRVLILERENGDFDIPKGRVEEGETPLEAAQREAGEETGMEIEVLEEHSCNVRAPNGFLYRFYLGITEEKTVDLTEHEEAYWVSDDEAVRMLRENKPHLAAAAHYLLDSYQE
jgi:8-oxo-dGTP pyrophosphatase MutT (NUDIX family)